MEHETAIPQAAGSPATDPVRRRTIEWQDPAVSAAAVPGMSGIEFLRAIADGSIPPPPIFALMNVVGTAVEPGRVTFTTRPDESLYNPIGSVHGGVLATLLDSAIACAVQTTLPRGQGYTSLELKVSYLRPATVASGSLVATGTVTKPGSRAAFGEGEVRDEAGRLLATGSSTCLVFPVPTT